MTTLAAAITAAWLHFMNRLRRSGVPEARLSQIAERIGMRKIRVLISNLADGPCVIGWISPVVLVPAAAIAGLTPQQPKR